MPTKTWKTENPFGLPFEPAEYERRLKAVRANMRAAKLDHMLVTGPHNIYYLTGHRTTGYYVYQILVLPLEGEPVFVTSKLEHTHVQAMSRFKACVFYTMRDDPLEVSLRVAERAGIGSGGIGYEDRAWFMQPRILDGFRAKFSKARFVPATGVIENVRAIKSDAELVYTRKAAEIASIGVRTAIAACREGRTENEVGGLTYHAMLTAGGEHTSGGPYVITGPRGASAHMLPERAVMERGHNVYLEIGGIYNRYAASCMRMVSIGQPSTETKRIAEVMVNALTAIVAAIKPGAASESADTAGRSVIEKAGLGEFFHHRVGYSMGCSFPPGWGEGTVADIAQGNTKPLEPGMVFHCVPCILIPEWGCMGFSETVLVTKTGSEVLTDCPRDLAISP